MKIIFFTILLITLSSCNLFLISGPLSRIKEHFEKKYNIIPSGISEEGMEGKYEHFGVTFNCNRQMTKKEAIDFVNSIYLDLFEKVNQYPSLQNEFIEQPVPKKCLHAQVFFLDKEYNHYPSPSVLTCYAYEKFFLIRNVSLRYEKDVYIREDIYYEYD